MKKSLLFFPLVSFALLGAASLAIADGPGYHLIKKIPLGTAPGGGEYFDYVTVDSTARRVYLSHGTEVKVLDADSFKVVGTLSGLKRCHGVVVLPDLGKGFITDGEAGQVVVFNLATLKITGAIKNSPDTDSIIFDPASKLIFTFNGDSKNVTVIDPVKETVVKVIDMGGGPEYPVADARVLFTTTMKRKTMSSPSIQPRLKSKRGGRSHLRERPWAWEWTSSTEEYFRPVGSRKFSS